MKINKIEWRNFCSYGNRKQELDFKSSNLYQIVGFNGAGKSSISQAISFALYGKVEGKTLKELPNRINGNAWVKIQIESNNNEVIIERGLEPNIFNLVINGTPYDGSDKRVVQDYLTDDILGIPHYVFNNTISLSVNDFKSFIKMSPKDKRAIIDKIFGFQILNEMRNILKEEKKKITGNLQISAGKLESLSRSIDSSASELELLSSSIEKDTKNEIALLEKTLITFSELEKIHNEKVSEFNLQYSKFNQNMRDTNTLLAEVRTNLRTIENQIDLYNNNDKCPTCKSELTGDFHESIKSGLEEERDKVSNDLNELTEKYEKYLGKDIEFSKKRMDFNEKGSKINAKISTINSEISRLNKTSLNSQVSSLNNIIESLNEEQIKTSSEKFKSEEMLDWVKTMDEVIGEKGVKQMAVRTILPSLNSEILDLLGKMNMEHHVIFDEDFNATIFHMGLEVPSSTLSTGEMKKVDFIVLVAILKLMKMKFSSINLLFLDELFSSVDSEGINDILKILKDVSKDMGMSVLVMNHVPMPHEVFDWKLEVTKPNNFSTINIDKF